MTEANKFEISKEMIRGHIDAIILSLLMDTDMYGYEVYKTVLNRTNSMYELKESSLYSAFRRLEKLEYIRSFWGEESMGGRRKYYAITDSGTEFCIHSRLQWKNTKIILDMLIGEE